MFAELYGIRPWELDQLRAWEFDALCTAADETVKEAKRHGSR